MQRQAQVSKRDAQRALHAAKSARERRLRLDSQGVNLVTGRAGK